MDGIYKMKNIIEILKKLPIDLGQANLRSQTEGKQIALRLVSQVNGKFALDIGCREGEQSEWLKNRGFNVEAIDIEPKYSLAKKIDVNNGLPYENKSFDLVWCSEVLEHLRDPQFIVSEIRRVLKENGMLILTTPNSNFWLYRLLRPLGIAPKKLQNPTHLHFFSFSDIEKLFSGATIYGYFPYMIIKLTLKSSSAIDLLSPTFVIKLIKENKC